MFQYLPIFGGKKMRLNPKPKVLGIPLSGANLFISINAYLGHLIHTLKYLKLNSNVGSKQSKWAIR